MPQDQDENPPQPEAAAQPGPPPRRRWNRWKAGLLIVAGLGLLAAMLGWFNREQLADRLIADELATLNIPARYRIAEISGRKQVLEDVVIGDPARPDLTIRKLELRVALRWGIPRISGIVLVKPRLYGTLRQGRLSFGSLDPVIFTDSDEPFELPDLDLVIRDGRGLLESDFGRIGIRAEGNGALRGGFAGILAATAPELAFDGCLARDASLYGRLSVASARPRFEGPVRLGGLDCMRQDLRLGTSGARLMLGVDPRFDGGKADVSLALGPLRYGETQMRALAGTARLAYRDKALDARYDLAGTQLSMPQLRLAKLGFEGRLRSGSSLKQIDAAASVAGEGLSIGAAITTALANAAGAGKGTLVQPLADQLRLSLARELHNGRFAFDVMLRHSPGQTSLVIPGGAVRGASGVALASVSRLQLAWDNDAPPRLAGTFAMGGAGLPKIAGQIEGGQGTPLALALRMAEYRAGTSRLELPRLRVTQQSGGTLGFVGEAVISGALPDGRVDALTLPLDGNWSQRHGIVLGRRCLDLRFGRLEIAGLRLERQRLPVCPPRGDAILRAGSGGMRLAAGLAGLNLAGRLGASPVRIRAASAAITWPGRVSLRGLAVALGPAGQLSDFRISRLDGIIGRTMSGRFEGAEILLDAVPLDLRDAAGAWRLSGKVLALEETGFRLEDRAQVDRFQPLVASDATLALADGVITAEARLREPASMREIVRTELRHDLASGVGSAKLHVDGLRFDRQVQPVTLTYLALGVIANAAGEVRGRGRIDWNGQEVTSTGSFTTDSLDFAAAFGPVKGLSGTVEFTDLLGLVTAPEQRLRVASINPGIEVTNGVVTFALEPDYTLRLHGATWPFLDGTLTMLPTTLKLGVAEVRRYTLEIDGIEAARFLERIEMDNLAATGRFAGTIPLVFDEDGGRIESGRLVSLPPGGNLSYVGDLSYEDLGALGNFAFAALRSLDYRSMRIDLDGSLEGEIITRVTMDGLSQGKGARRNVVTRQIARLPIRFNVNIRAPFFRLVTSVRSLFDPEYLRNPETLEIMDLPVPPGEVVETRTPVERSVQPSDSEKLP